MGTDERAPNLSLAKGEMWFTTPPKRSSSVATSADLPRAVVSDAAVAGRARRASPQLLQRLPAQHRAHKHAVGLQDLWRCESAAAQRRRAATVARASLICMSMPGRLFTYR
jgi:hypothetical protein